MQFAPRRQVNPPHMCSSSAFAGTASRKLYHAAMSSLVKALNHPYTRSCWKHACMRTCSSAPHMLLTSSRGHDASGIAYVRLVHCNSLPLHCSMVFA